MYDGNTGMLMSILDENWRQLKRRLKVLWGKVVGAAPIPLAAPAACQALETKN
jgi:hypothetical protein